MQLLIANNTNALTTATLTASSVRASAAVFPLAPTRTGNGSVALSGSYTGDSDSTFEIKITSISGADRLSTPIFTGEGSGTITGLAAAGLDAQAITITLKDLGVDTCAAATELFGVTLTATAPGAAGNSVTITVSSAAITRAALTPAATTFAEIAKDQCNLKGNQWNYGAPALTATGLVPDSAPRIAFDGDPQIYRQYKVYENREWVYKLTPAAPRTIPAGRRVMAVTGAYTVTVVDGLHADETYSNIVTLYDFLAALAGSQIVTLAGAVVNDRKPGGMGVLDLPLVTEAYALPWATNSRWFTGFDAFTVAAAAPTEQLTLECVGNDILGSEVWSVSGAVSGRKSQAVTGEAYSDAPYEFTIPAKYPEVPDNAAVSGGIYLDKVTYVTRTGVQVEPPICVKGGTIGRAGRATSLTLTYTKYRNTEGCACESAGVTGLVNRALLGLQELEGGTTMLDPAYQSRLEALYTWREAFVRANTTINPIVAPTTESSSANRILGTLVMETSADLASAETDLTVSVNKSFDTSASATAFIASLGDNTYATHVGSNTYPYYRYELTGVNYGWDNSGLTMAYNPVTDKYVVTGNLVPAANRKYLVSQTSATTATAGNTSVTFPSGLLNFDVYNDADTYRDTILGLSNVNLSASSVTVNSDTHTDVIDYGTSYQKYDAAAKEIGWMDRYLALLLDSLARVYSSADALALWDSLYTEMTGDLDGLKNAATDEIVITSDLFLRRYQAAVDNVYLAAGIVPGKSSGSAGASGGWSRKAQDYWNLEGYAPLYTNEVYHSTKFDANGDPYCTQEWAFALAIACPQHLQYGDQVVVNIDGGAATVRTYQVGDSVTVPIVAAAPLLLTGGVSGDDTVTWGVTGSVHGAFADYEVVGNTPQTYSNAGLSFRIDAGGIPFAQGDTFRAAIEGGTFKWRQDTGAWSGDIAIGDTLLADGLTARFTSGAAPSFAVNDLFPIEARQPYAPANLLTPDPETWEWSGASATLTFALAADTTVTYVALARYVLPAGATVSAKLKKDTNTVATKSITWSGRSVAVTAFSAATEADTLEITLANATAGSIGWIWLGTPLSTTWLPEEIVVRTVWDMAHGPRSGSGGIWQGSAKAGRIVWNRFLSYAELSSHLTMIDACKTGGDLPIAVVPNHANLDEAFLAVIESDSIDMVDEHQYHPTSSSNRLMSLTLPFGPVYQ